MRRWKGENLLSSSPSLSYWKGALDREGLMIKHTCTNTHTLYTVTRCSDKCSLKVCTSPPHKKKDLKTGQIIFKYEISWAHIESLCFAVSYSFLAFNSWKNMDSFAKGCSCSQKEYKFPCDAVHTFLLPTFVIALLPSGHIHRRSPIEKKQVDQGQTLLSARRGRQCWPPGEKARIQGQDWDLNPFWQHYEFKLGLFSF